MTSPAKIICIMGPTASGKTGVALRLASTMASLDSRYEGITVINADSRQLYHDFPIITAQPTLEERTLCPHELYGLLPTDEKTTAAQWTLVAKNAINKALAAHRLPVLVGGTGMYIKALLDGIADIPSPNPEVSQRLLAECMARGPQMLHERLLGLDPAYAVRIHPNDRQRIIRALEVWESTGRTFSWWHGQTGPGAPYDTLRLGIGVPIGELESFLTQRIAAMINQGAVDEAKAALERCPSLTAPGWTGIGCAELGAWLAGSWTWEKCIAAWRQNTRAYAKRQWTWFRADSRIQWFRPEEADAQDAAIREFLAS